MHPRSEKLIQELNVRFDYTNDNNRDLIGDPMFPLADTVDELNVQWAFQYIISHLAHCDEATDKACWGD
jgi:hypothetical protein